MVYSYAKLMYYKKNAKGSIILNMYKQAQIYTESVISNGNVSAR